MYVQKRQQAMDAARPPFDLPQFNEVESALHYTLYAIRNRFELLCEQAFEAASYLPSLEKELCLRRLSDILTSFEEPMHLSSAMASTEDQSRISDLRWDVLTELIQIYESQHDFPEAHRLRRILANVVVQKLSSNPRAGVALDAASLSDLSTRLSKAFHQLAMPHRHRQLIDVRDNLFPAAHLAIFSGRWDAFQDVLASSSNNWAQSDILKRQLLHVAVETQDIELVNNVIDLDQTASAARDILSMSPLFVAAYVGNMEVFHALCSKGADIEARDCHGRSVLCAASGAGNASIVEYLLEKGLSPDEIFTSHWSPLHAAVVGNHLEVAKKLLAANANQNIAEVDLIQVAKGSHHYEMASLLEVAALQNTVPRSLFSHDECGEDTYRPDLLGVADSPLPLRSLYACSPSISSDSGVAGCLSSTHFVLNINNKRDSDAPELVNLKAHNQLRASNAVRRQSV